MRTIHQNILSKTLKLALFFTICVLDLMACASSKPKLVIDAAGNANAIWILSEGTTSVVQTAFLPKGGSWSTSQSLFSTCTNCGSPILAGNATGDAVALWLVLDDQNLLGVSIYNSSTATWGSAQAISTENESVTSVLNTTLDDFGNIVVLWLSYPKGGGPSQISLRTSSASVSSGIWSPPITIAP